MGLNSESGEASCEDLDSKNLEEIVQETSDIDKMLKDSDDEVPMIEIPDDVVVPTNKCEDSNVDRTSKTHACPYEDCDLVFNRPFRLANHLCCHEGKRVFKCEVSGCEKAYFNSSHLRRHVGVKHKPQSMHRQHLICPHPGCLMELSNEHNLKRHYKRKHKQEYPFMCQYCDKGFSKHNQLRAHLYQHTGVPPLRCSTCNAGFTYSRDLKRHERGHKTYVCDCGQEFQKWSLMRTHTKLCHTAEFICDVCKKCFTTKCRLRGHMVVHQDSSEREVIPCPYENCPRFYYEKRNLNHHIRSSHEGKKYECPRPGCGRKLCTQKKLEYHMKLHDAKRPLPRRSHKARKRRCDAGKPKRSMAVLLSGIVISREEEKALLNANSDAVLEMQTENSIPVRNSSDLLELPPDHEISRKCAETAVKECDISSREIVSCDSKEETGFDALGAISVITLTGTDPGICNKRVLLKQDDSETKQMKDNVYEQSTPLMETVYHISSPIHGTDVIEELRESESFCVTNVEILAETETADARNEPTSQDTDEQYQKYLNSLKSVLAKKQNDKGIVENCETSVSYVLNNKASDASNCIIAKSAQGLLQIIPQCGKKEEFTVKENKDVANFTISEPDQGLLKNISQDERKDRYFGELNTDEANIIPSTTQSKTDLMFPLSSQIHGNKRDLVKMLDSDSFTNCLQNYVSEETLSNNSYLSLENLQSLGMEDSVPVRPTLDVPVEDHISHHKTEINNSCGEMFQEDVSSQVGKRKRICLQEIENVPSSDIAPQKHKRKKKEMQTDVETRPSSSGIPSHDCKEKLPPLPDISPQECEMEINNCKGKALEGNTASCDIVAQEFEGKNKALDINVDTSLEVPSQKCEVKRKPLKKTVTRLHSLLKVVSREGKGNIKPLSEYDISHSVPQNGDIVGVPGENQVMKVLETNQDSFRGSNSFVSSCINEDAMACCKDDPASVEDIHGKRVETFEETNPFYIMSIKQWIYIMQRIMEEMFPTIKNSFTNKSNSIEFSYKLNSP